MMRLAMGLCLLAGMAVAEEPVAATAVQLPEATVKRIAAGPEAFADRIGVIVAGYGAAGGIDRAGIARYIAVERAATRAGQIGRMLAADGDNDGTVTQAEVAALSGLIAARARGALIRAFAQGDTNGDGAMDMAEIRANAQRAALRRLGEPEADMLRSLMLCDLDRDGILTPAEVSAVVAALALRPAAATPHPAA